jgi:hypothetical protein
MQIVLPPTALTASTNGAFVNLNWNASADSSLLGYHVYRAPVGGSFSRLTTSPTAAQSYQDLPGSGAFTYMIRAIKFESGYSGTFTNASEGVLANVNVVTATTPVAISRPQWNGSQISFLCTGQPGQRFAVECSSNLTTWTAISTNVLVSSPLTFADTRSAALDCFYRTRLNP